MKKRGQISSHVFFYIFAVIILGSIFVFGIIAIKNLGKAKGEAELITFESKIEGDLERIASSYGDVNFKDYRFPGNIGEVVFVDISSQNNRLSAGLASAYPVIADKIEDGIGDDVFLFDDNGDFLKSMDVGELTIAGPGWIAYKNENGRFEVKLEGKGDEARIGGDFEKVVDFVNGKVDITLDEFPGLRLHLEQEPSQCGDCKVALIIEKAPDAEGIKTDFFVIDTRDASGNTYDETIDFVDDESYIEIPVDECREDLVWNEEYADCSTEGVARFEISEI